MVTLTKERKCVTFFIIVIFVYFSYESAIDRNETNLTKITPPGLNVNERTNNAGENVTILKTELSKHIVSRLINTSYPEIENDTHHVIVKPTIKPVAAIIPLNFTQELNSKKYFQVTKTKQESNSEQSHSIKKEKFFKYISKKLTNDSYAGVDNYIQYRIAKFNIKQLTGIKPLRPKFGLVLNDVTSFQYPIGIKSCRYVNGSRNLFVAIISAFDHFEKRESIRQTWLQALHQNKLENVSSINLSGYGFITGKTKDQNVSIRIEEESKKHGDILQIDLIDNYFNLTLKVVGLLNYLNKYCSKIDFVLKVDDDVFVNIRNLGAVITKTLNRNEQFLIGSFMAAMKPERSETYSISYENWPWSNYPEYPSGGAVLFSGVSIAPLLAAAQVTPYIPYEDTYLLGLCTEKAGIKIRGFERFFVILEGEIEDPCHVYNCISWETSTMRNSFLATEKFYNKLTQCIMADSNDVNRIMNPFDFLLKIE